LRHWGNLHHKKKRISRIRLLLPAKEQPLPEQRFLQLPKERHFPMEERLRLESEIHHLQAGHPQGRVERPPPRKGSPLAHKEHPEAVE
jgi:hypothetical protein